MYYAILLMILFASQLLYSLPLSNPADPYLYTTGLCKHDPYSVFSWKEVGMLRVGFYGDYVFNANLEVDSNQTVAGCIQKSTVMTNAGMLVFNAYRFVDLYGTLGTSKMTFVTNGGAFSNDASQISIQFDDTISWTIGGRGILWQKKSLTIGAQAQYQRFNPQINSIFRKSAGAFHFPNSNQTFLCQWWQAAVAVSYTACSENVQFVPYMGLKWSGAQLSLNQYQEIFPGVDIAYTLNDLVAKKLWGYGVGMTALFKQKASVTISGQFADETSMSVNGQICF